MTREQQISNVIGAFYDAAVGGRDWTHPLGELARLFHAPRAWLLAPTLDGAIGHTSLEDDEFHSPVAKRVMSGDRLLKLSLANPEGAIVRHSEMESSREFQRRELFSDWLKPRDAWFGLQAHLYARPERRAFVEVSHNQSQGDFTDDDKELMRLIAPHIRRAGELSRIMQDRASNGFPTSPTATVVVNRSLKVIKINDAALTLIERLSDYIGVSRGELRSKATMESAALSRAVSSVTSGTLEGAGAGKVLLLGQDEDNPAGQIVADICRFGTSETFGLPGEPLAIVHLRAMRGDSEEDSRFSELLCDLFQMRPSQARLACALMSGASLKQAAAERGLSYATARTYLDQIYRETGVNHQGALVALLQSLRATHSHADLQPAGQQSAFADCDAVTGRL